MYFYRTRQRIFRPLTVVNISGKLGWGLHTLHHVTLPMIQIEQSCLNFFWLALVKQCTSLQLVSDILLMFLVTLALLVNFSLLSERWDNFVFQIFIFHEQCIIWHRCTSPRWPNFVQWCLVHICGPWVWNLLYFAHLLSTILGCLLDF